MVWSEVASPSRPLKVSIYNTNIMLCAQNLKNRKQYVKHVKYILDFFLPSFLAQYEGSHVQLDTYLATFFFAKSSQKGHNLLDRPQH